MTFTRTLNRGLLIVAAVTLANCAKSAETLELIDGLKLDVSEIEFRTLMPTARLFNDARFSATSNSYIYAAAPSTTYLGYPVSGYGRGFESGRGCFAGVGMDGLELKQVDALRKRVGDIVGGDASSQYRALIDESVTNRFANAKVRVLISARRSESSKNGEAFAVSIGVSATNCDRRLAQALWGTLTE